jgi:hypothetical protein
MTTFDLVVPLGGLALAAAILLIVHFTDPGRREKSREKE